MTQMKPSLFIGRWQPFHEGHQALVETVLKQGKPVIIAVRCTARGPSDPYSVEERWAFISEVLADYGSLVRIIAIPDFDEICYGRGVGYGIRRVDLDEEVEAVSATRIRAARNRVVWLTGNTGAGKTTLAYLLKERMGAVVLDGDEMRESISVGAGFGKKAREAHNLRVARLARVLYRQRQNVIVSVIAPFKSTRRKVEKIIKPIWVYVKREMPHDPDRPYEEPEGVLVVDTDRHGIMECVDQIWEAVSRG